MIEPQQVKHMLEHGDRFLLLDVREPHEYLICNIPGAKLIPLGELPKRVNELDTAQEIVVHCKSGMRSAKACDFLRQSGFRKVRNMTGGIGSPGAACGGGTASAGGGATPTDSGLYE